MQAGSVQRVHVRQRGGGGVGGGAQRGRARQHAPRRQALADVALRHHYAFTETETKIFFGS